MMYQPVSISWHVLIVFGILLMLLKWAWNEVLRGCNNIQRTLGEFIAFHWVEFTVWSTSIGCSFESRLGAALVPCGYGSGGDRTPGRRKSCGPRLREIRSRVASSRCINSEIALPTIWLDDVVLSPWTRTLNWTQVVGSFPPWSNANVYVSHSLERPISIENEMLRSISIFLNQ
jgi:hypothetical protein